MVTTRWRKAGDIKIDLDDRKAVLLVNEKPYSEKSFNLEALHELLHVRLYALDQMLLDLLNLVYGEEEGDPKREFACTQFMTLLESTTEDLTKGFIATGGDNKELDFGRLQSEIDEELKS